MITVNKRTHYCARQHYRCCGEFKGTFKNPCPQKTCDLEKTLYLFINNDGRMLKSIKKEEIFRKERERSF